MTPPRASAQGAGAAHNAGAWVARVEKRARLLHLDAGRALKWTALIPFYSAGWLAGVVARSLRLMAAAVAEGFKDGAT